MNWTRVVAAMVFSLSLGSASLSQAPKEQANVALVNRIWEEETSHSQAMEILSYLTDVIGPRVQGSPAIRKAREWASGQLKQWGLEKVTIEPCGTIGLGWSNDYISVHMIEPSYMPIIAYAKPWTRGTRGKIRGEPVLVELKTKEDLDKYRGKLKGAIVLTQQPRPTRPSFEPPAKRLSDEDLKQLTTTPIPVTPRRSEPPEKAELDWEELEAFYTAEEVGVLVEPSSVTRSDYGTVKVDAYEGNGKDDLIPNRSPRIVMAAEHYARICRIMGFKVPVTLEIEVKSTIYDQDRQGYNLVAEIPGTDKLDEIVMLGAHLDSWAAGTGAADNAAGTAVTMETVRILKRLGLRPRRTIRLALWTGEETAFYGSRGYVIRHFGDTDKQSLQNIDWETYDEHWKRPLGDSSKILATPEYDKISGYFNYDNGSGRIRGIYIQENFQVKPIFEAWMEPLRDLGVTTIALRSTRGTDHLPFDWIGIPGFQFVQDPLDYIPQVHHTNQDLYDHCSAEDLIQSVVVMATFVAHAAMREEKLPRKPLPIPVEAK